jgi:hypothetical protein
MDARPRSHLASADRSDSFVHMMAASEAGFRQLAVSTQQRTCLASTGTATGTCVPSPVSLEAMTKQRVLAELAVSLTGGAAKASLTRTSHLAVARSPATSDDSRDAARILACDVGSSVKTLPSGNSRLAPRTSRLLKEVLMVAVNQK